MGDTGIVNLQNPALTQQITGPIPVSGWFQQVIRFSDEHTELLVSLLFAVSLIVWALFIPVPWKGYVSMLPSGAASQSTDVWRQYAENFGHFKWGVDLNLYLYSSLRFVAIALSAVTPALIVAPSLKEKKVLAALPAVVVAIATGLIAEFDFKDEAARFDAAQVQMETEKSLFLTQARPFYWIANKPCASKPGDTTGTSQAKDDDPCIAPALSLQGEVSDVPFAHPANADQTTANFAYRLDKIRQTVASERDQFLRGKPPSATTGTHDAPGSTTNKRQPSPH